MGYSTETECVSIWVPIVADLKPMIAEVSNSAVNGSMYLVDHHSGNSNDSANENGRNQLAYEYVLFTMGLINALLNSFVSLEDRVACRNELEQLGFDKIVDYLSELLLTMEEAMEEEYQHYEGMRDDPWIERMSEFLELYQDIKVKDMEETSLDGINVSNPA